MRSGGGFFLEPFLFVKEAIKHFENAPLHMKLYNWKIINK